LLIVANRHSQYDVMRIAVGVGVDIPLRIGCSFQHRTYVSILKLGQQQPSLMTILKIAQALDCTAGKLVELVVIEIRQTTEGCENVVPKK
jgi:hypothetical protein